MFYTMYLSSVCQRRQWPDPLYEPYCTRNGHYCKVRVNNREYSTEVPYASEALARDGAAQKAYMICRNFSVNDGMYPGQRPGQRTSGGAIQGLPVAIGTGRRSNRSSGASYDTSSTDGTSSGGDSPRSTESGFELQMQQVTTSMQQVLPQPVSAKARQSSSSSTMTTTTKTTTTPLAGDEYVCLCRRATVRAYGRCGYCLRESGWA